MVTRRLLEVLVRDAVTRYCVRCLADAADRSTASVRCAVPALVLNENVQALTDDECDLCGQRAFVLRRRKPPALFE